jgi:hypothetical protein
LLLIIPLNKDVFMPSYTTLELGDTADALAWQKGCESLGFMPAASIMKMSPTLDELEALFRSQPEWAYFSGHIWGSRLYGDGTAQLEFQTDRVVISTNNDVPPLKDKGARILLKADTGFAMNKSCLLVILAGCSGLASLPRVKVIRELFFNPTILGYASQCNATINTEMMGGGSNRSHFFANYASGADMVNAWLQSGLSRYSSMQTMFRAFDPDGQEWKLVNSKVVKGGRV